MSLQGLVLSAADRDPGAIGMKGLVAAECGLGFGGVGGADAGGCRALAGSDFPSSFGKEWFGPRGAQERPRPQARSSGGHTGLPSSWAVLLAV